MGPTSVGADRLDDREALRLLATAELRVEGQLVDASNVAVRVLLGEPATRAVYKPVRGERPLWDFPDGTLAAREVAAYLVSRAGGWHLVPPTVLREGPFGVGSVQLWVDTPAEDEGDAQADRLLELFDPGGVPPGWLPVLHAELGDGAPVVLAHADRPDLQAMAVLDVVLNNADRKGSHLAVDAAGCLWGFDHGVSLHHEPKLRTILWGWAGRPVPPEELARLHRLAGELDAEGSVLRAELAGLLTEVEVAALRQRVRALQAQGVLPVPDPTRTVIPWPPW